MDCGEAIAEGDSGFLEDVVESLVPLVQREAPRHRECLLRRVLGSVGHQQGKCSCFGGTYEDPPDMTPREAARAAVAYYEAQHGKGVRH